MQNRETIVSLCLENRNRNITAVSTKKIWPTIKSFGKLPNYFCLTEWHLLKKQPWMKIKKLFPATKTLSKFWTPLNIPEYDQCDPKAGNIDDPIIKYIVKNRNRSSILTIKDVWGRGKEFPFAFSQVDREEILKEIVDLDISKTSQGTDITTKVITDNSDLLVDFLLSRFNCWFC